MSKSCKVTKVSYSNEFSSESAMWIEKYIESLLMQKILGKNITKLHLLLMKSEV